ncbi:MAG: cob(I)yrinic acid a,c-diamide adenosyltransferase [Oligoflexales bacterium]|nr:cob(I)yrinic acid a,c-diamide adenosyltransferase [Oligoflexales bacterium]
MKIYTKSGDSGKTSLFSGVTLLKSHARIEAYGTVDELNSFVGSLKDSLFTDGYKQEKIAQLKEIESWLRNTQVNLFNLGSELANPSAPKSMNDLPSYFIQQNQIVELEKQIDFMTEKLPRLTKFILPGGHICNSSAHVCRTVCRRAERRAVELNSTEKLRSEILIYLNRLSDWFFTLSRFLSYILNSEEILWLPQK